MTMLIKNSDNDTDPDHFTCCVILANTRAKSLHRNPTTGEDARTMLLSKNTNGTGRNDTFSCRILFARENNVSNI